MENEYLKDMDGSRRFHSLERSFIEKKLEEVIIQRLCEIFIMLIPLSVPRWVFHSSRLNRG